MASFPAGELQQISIEAPAKINWFLAIKGRRPDGYHDLETGMQKLQLADLLHIRKAESGIRLSCPGADLPLDHNNLAYRAAEVFLSKYDIPAGVEILLEKKIPIAAGLGGGSSDAAAVLRGLNALFATRLEIEELLSLARSLGADVPFFVEDYDAAWATGIGDVLSKADPLQNVWIVLVNPGFAVSTKWVYENFALTTEGNPYILGRELGHKKGRNSLILFNDLESVTIPRFPEVGEIKEKLIAGGSQGALMSGSGPTVFGLFDEKQIAVKMAEFFQQRYGDNVFLTRPRAGQS